MYIYIYEVLELIFCPNLRKYVREACPCVDNGLPCTDACVKQKCENYAFRDSDIDDIELDYLSFDDENCKTLATIFPHVSIFPFTANTSVLFCYPLEK